jgi:hypothetical protein
MSLMPRLDTSQLSATASVAGIGCPAAAAAAASGSLR